MMSYREWVQKKMQEMGADKFYDKYDWLGDDGEDNFNKARVDYKKDMIKELKEENAELKNAILSIRNFVSGTVYETIQRKMEEERHE